MGRRSFARALAAASAPLLVAVGCAGNGERYDAADASAQMPPPAPGDTLPGTMVFEDHGERPFSATADDPLSTFATDVDTGSYSVGRAYLREDQLPEPASIRVEEYVNAFGSGFPAATDAALALHADGAPVPLLEDTGDRRLVRVGLTTVAPDLDDRPPATLTVVIDTSGSMDTDDRLGLATDAVATLARSLGPEDSVAVVEYGSEARVVLPHTPANRTEAIEGALDELSAGGSTNAEAGLSLAYDLARDAFEPEGTNRVLLLSDGVANVGRADAGGILDTIGDEARDGIQLVTVGVGFGNYSDVMMEQLANRGDGFYSYVNTREEADDLFGDELPAVLDVVAEEAKLQVELDPALIARYRLVGFENRDLPDEAFRDDLSQSPLERADAGELGPGHEVTALYEIELVDGAADTLTPESALATVRARWTDPGSGESQEIDRPILWGDVAERWDDATPELQLAALVATWARVLRGSPELEQVRLDDVASAVSSLPAALRDRDDVAELEELVERSADL